MNNTFELYARFFNIRANVKNVMSWFFFKKDELSSIIYITKDKEQDELKLFKNQNIYVFRTIFNT